jgi:hypothetical protein
MITDIYRKYFQKSYNFLYPLLGLKKHKTHKPSQTYIEWEDVCDFTSRKLICVFKRQDTPEWKHFEMNYLIAHSMLDHCVPIDENTIAYVFDLNSKAEDFDAFCNGQYSRFSSDAKKMLSNYYGVHTPEWVFMESYVYPEKYFKKYAEILLIDVDILKKVGELCEKYDQVKEVYTTPHPEISTYNINQ